MLQDLIRALQNNLYESSEEARRNMANRLYPIEERRNTATGLGLLGAALLGAAAAFFLSPRSGKENQKMVKQKAMEILEKGEELGEKAKEKAGEVVENVKTHAENAAEKVKTTAQNVAETTSDKINAFKNNVADNLENAALKMKKEEVGLEKDIKNNFSK